MHPIGPHAHSVQRGLRKFPLTRPLRQAPVGPPIYSILLVPAGRIPGITPFPPSFLESLRPRPLTSAVLALSPTAPPPRAEQLRWQRLGRLCARARVMVGVAGVGRCSRGGLPGSLACLTTAVYLEPRTLLAFAYSFFFLLAFVINFPHILQAFCFLLSLQTTTKQS